MRLIFIFLLCPVAIWADEYAFLVGSPELITASHAVQRNTACSYCISPDLVGPDIASTHMLYIEQPVRNPQLSFSTGAAQNTQNTQSYQAEIKYLTPVAATLLNLDVENASSYASAASENIDDSFQRSALLAQSHLDIGKYSHLDLYAQFQAGFDEKLERARLDTSELSAYELLVNLDVANLGPLENMNAQLYAAITRQEYLYPEKWNSLDFFDNAPLYQESQFGLSLSNSLFLGYLKLLAGIDMGMHLSRGKYEKGDYFLPEVNDRHIGTYIESTFGLGDDRQFSMRLNWQYLDRNITNNTLNSGQSEPSLEQFNYNLGVDIKWLHRVSEHEIWRLGLSSKNELPQSAQQFLQIRPVFSSVLVQGNPDLKLIRHNQLDVELQHELGIQARLMVDYVKGYVTLDYAPDQLTFRSIDALLSQAEVRLQRRHEYWAGQAGLVGKKIYNLTDDETATGISPYQAMLGLTFKPSVWQIKVEWKYVAQAARHLENSSGQEVFNNGVSGDYQLVRLSGGLDLDQLQIEVAIGNLFDARYSPHTDSQYLPTLDMPDFEYLGQERNFQLSLAYIF